MAPSFECRVSFTFVALGPAKSHCPSREMLHPPARLVAAVLTLALVVGHDGLSTAAGTILMSARGGGPYGGAMAVSTSQLISLFGPEEKVRYGV